MAVIKQTPFVTGKKDAPTPYQAGHVACAIFEYTVNDDITAATDIIAIGYLPAGCIPVDSKLVSGALGASTTADVGFMSGELGSTDANQTSGDEIFDAGAAHSAVTAAPLADLFAITATDKHRPIGLKVNQDVTATGQKIQLALWYRPA